MKNTKPTGRTLDMTKGSPMKLLFTFALPLFLGNLLQQFYNLADTSQMYCTELVEFAYQKADICLSEGRRTQINVPAMGGTYLMPDDIAANKRLKILYSFP